MIAGPAPYTAAAFAVLAAISLYFFRQHRHPFLMFWGAAWAVLSVRQAAAAVIGPPAPPWIWIDLFMIAAAAALVLLGGFAYAGPANLGSLRSAAIGLVLGVLAVLVFTALVRVGPVPGHAWAAALACLSVAGMGAGWLIERHGHGEDPVAAPLTGAALAGWGALQPLAWMMAAGRPERAGWLPFLDAALVGLLSAGVILLGVMASRRSLLAHKADPRDLFDEDPNMILVLQDGRYVFVNRAFRSRSGWGLEDVSNADVFEHVAPEFREEARRHLEDRLRGASVDDYELEFIDAQHRRVPVIIHADPIQWDGRDALRYELTDITSRRQTENEIHAINAELYRINSELEKSNQLKNEFLSNTTHELKTPLTSIIANTEILEYEMCGAVNEEQRRVLANISRNSQHLLEMISRLLDFSRHEEGHALVRYEQVDLPGLIAGVADTVRPLLEDGTRRIAISVDEAIEPSYLDADKIYRVYLNLVENAIKFSRDGEIRVGAERIGDEIEGFVSDRGIGIPREKLQEIFEAFRQVDASSTRPYQGVGLGLAICKQLIELHGGRIWAESSGEGSDFRFRVPYLIDPPAGAVPPRGRQSLRAGGVR